MARYYTTVKIPMELSRAVDEIIERGARGYKSRAEFIKEAVRLRLEEVQGLSSKERAW